MKALYRALLLLYPRRFRLRYTTELLDAYDAERSAAGARTRVGTLRFWSFLLADLLASASRQRYREAHLAWLNLTGRGAPQLPGHSRRGFMDTVAQDIRYAIRQFARRPGFTAVAVISLMLGIGGNSVMYGLMDGFVFNPFPYPDGDRLVAIGATFPKVSNDTRYVEALSPAEYRDIRTAQSLATVAAFDLGNRNISGGDVPERVFTALLLDDLFPVMGMPPLLGRGFTAEELAPGGPRVAIISHRLWRTRFGADPRMLERPIRIGGEATSVVGVMPPGLVLAGTDLWIPWGGDPALVPRTARQFTILGRLAPGVTPEQATAELSTIAARIRDAEVAALKEYDGWRLDATPFSVALMNDLRPAAFILLATVALVLLIACANLTNLMLARAMMRSRELAVRLALGAARWRIARQLLTESALLAGLGAAGGLLLAYLALQSADALVPAQFQTMGLDPRVNARVLAWTLAATLLAALLVALLPIVQATRTDPHDTLKSDTRGGARRAGTRVRHALIVAEIALSVVLLLGAGLLMRSLLKMQSAEPGYDPRGVLTMRLTLPFEKYESGEAHTAFFERLVQQVRTIPGVTTSAVASQFPPSQPFQSQIEVEGVQIATETLPMAKATVASADYFRTIGLPLVRGRFFGTQDTPEAPRRVIVNQAFVTQYIKDRDPLATRVRPVRRGQPGDWTEIVGVVGNARNDGAGAPSRPEVFIPMEQGREAWQQLFLLIRTEGDPATLVPQVRSVVAGIDPEQPVYLIQTMEEAVAVSTFQQRVAALLIGIFAAVALILSAVGIYGVMSYAVSARTQEIGVRMAVGAERSDVMRLVLSQVARLTVIGAVIGVALLWLSGRALSSLLYGVTPSDPVTIVLVTLALGAVALIAAWVPAYRASRVNPIEALRYE